MIKLKDVDDVREIITKDFYLSMIDKGNKESYKKAAEYFSDLEKV